MARYIVLSETNNIDTNWSTFLTLLRDLEHRSMQLKSKFRTQWSLFPSGLTCSRFDIMVSSFVTIRSNIWGVSVPRHLVVSSYVDIGSIKRKNTLSKKVASSSDPAIRQEYNRVRNKVKWAVNKMKKKFEKDLYENARMNMCSRSLKRVKKVDQLVSMLLVSLSTVYLDIWYF
jgi:hypothetical protein